MRLLRAFGLFIGVAIMPASAAENHPSVGFTSGATDKDFIQYQCDRPTQAGMVCKFTQVTVRTQAKLENLDEKLSRIAEFEKQIREKPTTHNERCKESSQIGKLLRSKDVPNDKEAADFHRNWEAMDPREKQDMLNDVTLFGNVCEAPTPENIAAIVRSEHEKDMRTCSVMVSNFEQTFQLTMEGVWLHSSAPEGECGIVSIASFEKAHPKFSLWNYRTRKVVNNKNGSSCTRYDETEHIYNWRPEMFFKGCDYVRYGF
jgi:hypothetical protein